MNPEQFGSELLQQYENMIANIAEWRTNIYNILQLAQWKKQQSPRMQSDITLIQNGLMDPSNFELGDFALQQVNTVIGYKTLFEQLVEQHRLLIQKYQTVISMNLQVDLEQKTMTLLTYFNYVQLPTSSQCVPLVLMEPYIQQSQNIYQQYQQVISPSQCADSQQLQALKQMQSNDQQNFNGKDQIRQVPYNQDQNLKLTNSNSSSWTSINSIEQQENVIDVE